MSGHSKWAQIKRQKGVTDKKRGQLFSKLLKAISISAKTEPNPQFNPRLRSAIETAKAANIPNDNIQRAVSKAAEAKILEEFMVEAYGPEGVALIIEGVTDNTNRSISEIKHILSENNAKIADPGSVLWAFERIDNEWQPKFLQEISEDGQRKITELIDVLENHEDVLRITPNF
ncbi:MAG: YebC/PmpR family DNA-binding transcriptional regulator [Candidatus Harrisonbacteria bacterium]|nr:YebC/PmpR family DNA-binding transcriptional regulator [Candidatus Harrisonbacteria bacterium]